MLKEFLAKALAMGGDRIEIEHKDRKEWITAFRGCVGCGIGCLDSNESIFKEMDDLKKRKQVTLNGTRFLSVVNPGPAPWARTAPG
jgi:hypothetical protein